MCHKDCASNKELPSITLIPDPGLLQQVPLEAWSALRAYYSPELNVRKVSVSEAPFSYKNRVHGNVSKTINIRRVI